jgi:PhnB protein
MTEHYLMFNRTCGAALKTYEEAFNAKITEVQRYKDMPPNPNFPVAPENAEMVLHARMELDGSMIMCADSPGVTSGNNMYISITTENEDYVKKAWQVLVQEGKVNLELTPSFFAKLHGSLCDQYGVNWMFTVPPTK